ncbi:DUF2339 domain-containing protein [Sphingomonas sp. RS2018]
MAFDLILLIGVIAAFAAQARRIGRLERMIEQLRDLPAIPADSPAVRPARPPARVVERPTLAAEVAALRAEPPEPVGLPEPPVDDTPATERGSVFESMVGGRLPIWVGGAALVVAGFFLVRYSIENGLIGPVARVALAALFAAALIAGSEIARRLPATRDDPRVGQVLAGAGVASAYGTLYVAVAQYHLVGAVAGFGVMIVITAGALFLALRHGPPTAVMALIGGFAAPLVAGFDAAGVGALLGYLALFIAALFALAARRGWSWLAIAAVVAGFGWANLVVVLLDGRGAAGVAAFVVALAIAATLALPRTGPVQRWMRIAPMAAGLVQMLVLAPTLDFSAVAWSFYLVLAAAAVVLAVREDTLLPAPVIAAALLVVLVAAAGVAADNRSTTLLAALAATLVTGGAGLALSRRARQWAAAAVVGLAGPVLALRIVADDWMAPAAWSVPTLAAAIALTVLAWRHRDRIGVRDIGLIGGSVAAGVLAGVALTTMAGMDWAGVALAPVLVALAWWSRRVDDADIARLPVVVVAVQAVLAFPVIADFALLLSQSLGGDRLSYLLLPDLRDAVRMILIPAGVAAAVLAWPRSYGDRRHDVTVALAVAAVFVAYALVKQPLAIGDAARFAALGFVERAAITLVFLGAGWALVQRTRFVRSGYGLIGIALARFVWFDGLILSPVLVAQAVGGVPVLNAAVVLPALIAAACLTLPSTRALRIGGLVAIAIAVVAGVRQIAHGTILTGGMEGGETWGYSAALLLLAIAWLTLGLRRRDRQLRVAALILLTLVTVKVFLIDVAALGGLLRILSLMGLGVALIGIGWAYNRIVAKPHGKP